ncbi:uncharacterized protein LOC115740812 [Rhodamnia argentea]|uniref:Uncharacterized protein LOC115740812 n=1 Tax=Rhodamnia argentea TaxID=178133 RepID=A0A8B8P670_9MYRT|nr:uncharacterized protein LOC115740812 [Rhodamnia argentea]XP_030530268.1 uncharacterized protein LOC115740812 [Rhodamnia argentea]
MDPRFQHLRFAANSSSNAFKTLGNLPHSRGTGVEYGTDTILQLDSPASLCLLSASKGVKRKWKMIDGSINRQVGCPLSLGLGRPSSSSDSKGSSRTACTTTSSAKETDEESSMNLDLDFTLSIGNDKAPSRKKVASPGTKDLELQPKVDLELSLSTGPSESDITCIHPNSSQICSGLEIPLCIGRYTNVDERSTSGCWKSVIYLDPLHKVITDNSLFQNQVSEKTDLVPAVPDLSSSVISTPKSSITCTSAQGSSTSKICQVEGCGKGARGASGRCISHGGGRRCQKPGCHKGAEGRTVYCKAHGGGRRCEFLGCTKSAEGRTDFCIAHGGGRRCTHDGCTRAARGKSGLCIRHGGGKRCQKENCTKSAEGLSGLCISHGGGRRCQNAGCTKGAQGSTMFCKAHGGGKRCTFVGCNKGAEGSTPFCKGHGGGKRCAFRGGGVCSKSVHGGTNFCVAHGGGKRCAVPECTRSARGRTDFCVRHGGGKRCKFHGCSKSAQGSTDFCKAHGGGKRCSWGQPGSEFGDQNTGSCNSFARGKTGLCALHSGLVQDKRVHGGFSLGPILHGQKKVMLPEEMDEDANAEDMNVDVGNFCDLDLNQYGPGSSKSPIAQGLSATPAIASEGRVHGGSLMAMLGGGMALGSDKD